MQARLCQAARRWPVAAGHGRGRGWSEAHLLVGVPPGPALALARRFRQLGIVTVRVGSKARLIVPVFARARPEASQGQHANMLAPSARDVRQPVLDQPCLRTRRTRPRPSSPVPSSPIDTGSGTGAAAMSA